MEVEGGKRGVCCRRAGLAEPGHRRLRVVLQDVKADDGPPPQAMNTATLSPTSPKVKRRQSARNSRTRAGSHLPPQQTQETHDAALYSIRAFLRSRTSYDAFPVSFRLIVLDSQLEVKKALQCLLLNGGLTHDDILVPSKADLTFSLRRRFCPPLEQREINLRWDVHRF